MTRGLRASTTLSLVLMVLVAGMGPVGEKGMVQPAAVSHAAQPAPEAAYDVIVNEWSQGHGGNQEWVELLVTTGPVDLRGWDLLDANSTARVTLSNDSAWQSVPVGTLIVIYNGGDRDTSLPPDDTDFGDCAVVIPHNNATYFSGSWPLFGNSVNGDNPHLRDAGDVTVHDYSTAPGATAALHPGAGQCTYYTGNTAAGVAVAASWAADQPADQATPGMGNGGDNTAWIAGMGCGQPAVESTFPADGATGVSRLTDLVVDFSENVTVLSGWYSINCSLSGVHTAVESGGPQSYALDPDASFDIDDQCTVTIYGSKVHDAANNTMAADYQWSFWVGADAAPSVSSTTPQSGATGVSPAANIVVNFGENVDVAGEWYGIECAASGSHSAVVSGGPQGFTLDPDTDFALLEDCTVTIYAAQVTDQDIDDPPDNMAADYTWNFTVGTGAPPSCGEYTPIYALQGSGSTAALTGVYTTQGIVIGDLQNSTTELSGFFLQDPWTDGNTATSDGIFVYNSS